MKTFLFTVLLLNCIAFKSQNSNNSSILEEKQIKIKKSTETIIVDGILSEKVWSECDVANDFWQNFPFDTSLAKSKTEVMLSYDDKDLHIAAICYDSLPGPYVITSLKRDFSYPVSDAFVVTLDPFCDKTNGFSFGVNPYGVQREGLVSFGGGMGVTTNWDNKWFCAVKRFKEGWVVEMAIPFKTLRYKENINEWRINFSRNDLKRNENSSWVKVPRNFNISSLAFTGKLIWDVPPKKQGGNIALIPYGITRASRDYFKNEPNKYEANVGMDAKIVFGSNLNLDLTINPDFSQVEVDRQLTNLTRFSLFFPEQRQFFLENSDLFERFGFRQIRPFFSRRIGLSNGGIIPIYAGARLSGKPNKNWRLGVMNLQTATKGGLDTLSQNYLVAAVQRNLFARSNLSFLFVNRQGFFQKEQLVNNYNRVVGLDYNLASSNNRWNGKFFFHHSISSKNNSNAFAHASFLNYANPNLNVEWNHEYVDKNYNAETGFVPRISQLNEFGQAQRFSYWRLEPRVTTFIYPKKSKINKMGPEAYLDYYANQNYKTTDLHLRTSYNLYFTNTSALFVDYNRFYTKLLFNTDVTFSGQKDLLPEGDYSYEDFSIRYKTDTRKKINGSLSGTYGSYFSGEKFSGTADLSMRFQPYVILGISYTRDQIKMPYLEKEIDLDLLGPKVEVSFSRSLFFTTFFQYNSQIKNFNINSRLQWRFKPMSDLFIVYSDNYNSINFGQKNKALVMKFVYWIGI